MLTYEDLCRVYAHSGGVARRHRFGGPEPRTYDRLDPLEPVKPGELYYMDLKGQMAWVRMPFTGLVQF